MSSEPREYLRHILDEAEYLLESAAGLTREEFEGDRTFRRAFVRSFEVMGEAVKNLPAEFLAAHPEVAWSGMARMRDRLIHGYVDVDYQLVWEAVQQDVPRVKQQVEAILAESG